MSSGEVALRVLLLHDRASLLPHWKAELSATDRERYLRAWQSGRSCADCRHWLHDEPTDTVGLCGMEKLAALTAPADWTCSDWEATNAR